MNIYITFVSWEDRFVTSLKHDLENNDIHKIFFFYFEDNQFFLKTQKKIQTLEHIVDNSNIDLIKIGLRFDDYVLSWKKMALELEALTSKDNAILNISTMPRNIIFSMLHFLDRYGLVFEIKYYSPIEHGQDLTKNPSKPQMILQNGGIIFPEKKTVLVVILGHDVNRVYQLYNFLEPYKILIGLGTDHQTKLPLNYNIDFKDISNKEIFYVNSFSHSDVFDILEDVVANLLENHNILLCSLGPKVEAIGMYKFHRKYPETALVYAPSKDYADDYSTGTNLGNIKTIASSWLELG